MHKFQLDGKLALVTGGNKGIGLGIARAMAGAGADVILAARHEVETQAAAAELRQTGRRVAACPMDLRETEKIPAWYDSVVASQGQPTILVNAAGTIHRTPAESVSLDDWNDTLAVNLTAVFLLCQAFARHCIAAGTKGKIINIPSLSTAVTRPSIAA
jgi:2-deoxy-D-gluconate 3-dehydrogenase